MACPPTNQTKNIASVTLQPKGIAKTWEDANETWDEADYPWDSPQIYLENETKHIAGMTLVEKTGQVIYFLLTDAMDYVLVGEDEDLYLSLNEITC